MIKYIIFFCLGLLFVSCSQITTDRYYYPKDTVVSKTDGTPRDLLSFYFPTTIQIETQVFRIEIDTFKLNWFSSTLYSAQEPILYNYYLGHDIYRFLWIRSFHSPIIFTLHKEGDKVWLTTKKLDRQPNFIEIVYVNSVSPKVLPNGELDFTESNGIDETLGDTVIKADRKAALIMNETKHLSEKEWDEFEKLLNKYSFWSEKPCIDSDGFDGSQWTIEGHLKDKYWFINRWSPTNDFRKAGEYLINRSGLKEEIY